jgi:hypothetical protein
VGRIDLENPPCGVDSVSVTSTGSREYHEEESKVRHISPPPAHLQVLCPIVHLLALTFVNAVPSHSLEKKFNTKQCNPNLGNVGHYTGGVDELCDAMGF